MIGVEPHPQTFEVYKRNCGGFAECHELALTSVVAPTLRLRDNARDGNGIMNTGMASLSHGDGIAVRVEAFDDFVAREIGDAPIRLLKLDCEGPEIPILLECQRVAQCQEIVCEVHAGKGYWDVITGAISARLRSLGFETTKNLCSLPHAGQGHLFARKRR